MLSYYGSSGITPQSHYIIIVELALNNWARFFVPAILLFRYATF